jgi:hypothetical protein
MKKIYSLFAFVLISTALFAQNTSNLIVFSEDGLKFYLILNGIRQNETAVTNIKVDKLNQPYYAAKIIFEDKTQPVLEKKYLPVVDAEGSASLEVTYKIKKNNKNVNVLRFFSQVPIAQAAPPSPAVQEIHYNTVPMPDIFTSITINETTTTSSTNLNSNVNVNAGGVNVNVNVNDPYYNRTTTTTSYTHTSSSSSSGNVNTNTNNNTASSGCGNAYAMSNSNFAAAKQTITKQSFDDTKLTTAKQVIKSNCLSSAQIKELMLLFSFEATRLDLAKFAHERCVDKNNYFLLNDAFEFESSVEELNNSIK